MFINVLSTAVDCGVLDDPDYGSVDIGSTTYGSEATYTCHHGYYLVGHASRVCLNIGKWGGYAPVCKRKYVECMKLYEFESIYMNSNFFIEILICSPYTDHAVITGLCSLTFCQQLLIVETWMILIMEMLTSAVQRMGPRQLTLVTMVTI